MKTTVFVFVLLLLAGTLLPGCSKAQVLDAYDSVVRAAGNLGLTSAITLKGEREFGEDRYTGTYEVDYVNFMGEESIFGGTALTWRSREALTVTWTIDGTEGTARLVWNCGADEPVVLTETYGSDVQVIYLAPGSNYFNVECENFTGRIELTIE